jgi:hypothetical protein
VYRLTEAGGASLATERAGWHEFATAVASVLKGATWQPT